MGNITYSVLRYHNNTLWYLAPYDTEEQARSDYEEQKKRFKDTKIQLRKDDNGVVSTLSEVVPGKSRIDLQRIREERLRKMCNPYPVVSHSHY